tara:strand:- start:197 stop:670 length:474 start_codon:yes stop_codon:yes gene_type:complete
MVSNAKMNELEKIVTNIVSRNKFKFLSQIKALAQQHYDTPNYPNDHQIRYIMKKAGIKKETGGFFIVTDECDLIVASRVCMRCDKNKPLKLFPRIYGHKVHDGHLLICKSCIQEESEYTFQTIAEIKGVYAYMEVMYRNTIDKVMYDRYWEKAYSAI